MYKLLTSSRGREDLSIDFGRDRKRRQRELTNNKNQKSKNHVRFSLSDIFGFVEHQKRGTFGLVFKLTLTRNSDNCVLNKDNAINNGKIKGNAIDWYVPHYTPSNPQQVILSERISTKTPTVLQYVRRSVFMKEVKTQNLWTFELGTQKGMNVLIWNIVSFQQRERQDSQNFNRFFSEKFRISSTN